MMRRLVLLITALSLAAGCSAACPEYAERERREHGKVVIWCER